MSLQHTINRDNLIQHPFTSTENNAIQRELFVVSQFIWEATDVNTVYSFSLGKKNRNDYKAQKELQINWSDFTVYYFFQQVN